MYSVKYTNILILVVRITVVFKAEKAIQYNI